MDWSLEEKKKESPIRSQQVWHKLSISPLQGAQGERVPNGWLFGAVTVPDCRVKSGWCAGTVRMGFTSLLSSDLVRLTLCRLLMKVVPAVSIFFFQKGH